MEAQAPKVPPKMPLSEWLAMHDEPANPSWLDQESKQLLRILNVDVSEPTPIYEPSPEPSLTPEVEKLDVSPFLDAVRQNVNYDSDPKFFKRMERRAANNPNEFFTVSDLPDGKLTLYFPDGLDGTARVGYRKTVDNIMVDDPQGPLNAFATDEAVIVDIDQDGTLGYQEAPDLLNWNQIKKGLSTYLVEPEQTKGLEWTLSGSSPMGPATEFKLTSDDPNEVHYYGGTEFGFLTVEHFKVEIPEVGTDIPVSLP